MDVSWHFRNVLVWDSWTKTKGWTEWCSLLIQRFEGLAHGVEDNALLQFTLLPKGCSLAPQSKSCFDRDPMGVDPMGGDPVKGSTWCETCMCLCGTISQVSSLITGLEIKEDLHFQLFCRSLILCLPLPKFPKCFAQGQTKHCIWARLTVHVFQSGKEEGHSEITLLKNCCSPWPRLQEPEQSTTDLHSPVLKYMDRVGKTKAKEALWSSSAL